MPVDLRMSQIFVEINASNDFNLFGRASISMPMGC